ncbi:hypothetical protein TNCV_1429651 [Trichonephila clavipes]|nr:hypothetical protein TNCV_1429651 [Trichonephila clavipes]
MIVNHPANPTRAKSGLPLWRVILKVGIVAIVQHLTRIKRETMNQSDYISDDSSEGNFEDVVLPDEVDIFVKDDEDGINDTVEV